MKQPAKLPKRQHFLPRMLQKRFSDTSRCLWAYDKRRPMAGIKYTNQDNLFVEGHIYTIESEDGSRSAPFEAMMSKLESDVDGLIARIAETALSGSLSAITDQERKLLITFMYFQHKRTPDFFRTLMPEDESTAFYTNSISEWEALYGEAPLEEKDRLLDPANIARRFRKAQIETLMGVKGRVFPALLDRGILVARIIRPKRSFVLGSFPFARFKSLTGREDLGDPQVELWMPISSNVAIGSYGERGRFELIQIDADRAIRQINTAIFNRSTVVASRSRELLHALIQKA